MLYDNYLKKIQRIASIMAKIVKHLVLILSITGAVVAVSTTLLATKGLTSRVECPSQVTYGDSYDCTASAFLSEVRYQYKSADGEEWSDSKPTLPGDYLVRAVGESSFGNDRYGKESAFTILKKPLAVRIAEESIVFGDAPTVVSDPLCYGDLLVSTGYTFEDLSQASTRATPDLSMIQIVSESGEDVTQAYDIEAITSTVSFLKRPLTIHVYSASKVYDSNPLICDTYEIIEDTTLGLNDALELIFPSLSEAGVLQNNPQLSIYHEMDGRSLNVTHQYDVTVLAGELKVEQRTARIKIGSLETTYNGNEVVCNDFEIDPEALVVGHSITANPVGAAPVDCGTYVNSLAFTIVDQTGADVTLNYWLTVTNGEIKINPAPLTVSTEGGTWVYDGEDHGSDVFTCVGLMSDHTAELLPLTDIEDAQGNPILKVTVSDVGSIENKAFVSVKNAEGTDVTANYEITYVYGILEITPRPMTVTTPDGSWVYDGQPHFNDEIEINGKVETHTAAIAEYAVVKDVTVKENSISLKIFDGQGADVTTNYEITYVYGTLEITPRPLKITTLDRSWVYDGQYHDFRKLDLDGIVDTHTANIIDYAKIKYVGTVENRIAVEIYDETKANVTANYEISYEYGTLEITPCPIKVTTYDAWWIYDGQSHSYTEVNIESPFVIYDFRIEEYAKITDVGTVENRVTIRIFDEDGVDVTESFAIDYVYGTLKVEPRPILLAIENTEKYYDGTPLYGGAYKVSEESPYPLVEGHTVTATVKGSQTEAGLSNSWLEDIQITDNGRDVTFNYAIKVEKGEILVLPRPITITSHSAEKRYDGTPLINRDCSISCELGVALVGDHRLRRNIIGSQTEIGTSDNIIEYDSVKIISGTKDVTYNYEITYEFGTLTVKPLASISIISESDIKIYDGQPLVNPNYSIKITEGELRAGDRIFVNVYGSITDPGTEPNLCSVLILDRYGADVSAYYDLSVLEGTLEVIEQKTESIPVKVGEIKNDRSATVYLRQYNYGDFNGRAWSPAPEYGKTLPGGLSYNYLTTFALIGYGAPAHSVEIRALEIPMIPYYMGTEGNYTMPSGDTVYGSVESDFTMSYYLIPDSENGFTYLSGYLEEYAPYEQEYREFVYNNYLYVDDETSTYLQGIIKEQGFSRDDPTSILRAASYIQNAAKYNLNYDLRLDVEENQVIAFLDKYKEGKCVHYATAATLLYRTMGIPARYVEGFMVETEKDTFVDIMTPGHAWVEVYIDGVGWIQVEVTGGDGGGSGNSGECQGDCVCDGNCSGGGGSGSGNGGSDSDELLELGEFEIMPVPQFKIYDGMPLKPNGNIIMGDALNALVEQGYTYEVEVSGEQTFPGIGESTITRFKLYDPDGKDVTKNCNVTYSPGILIVVSPTDTEMTVGKIKNDRNGYVYLRMHSYGDFDGRAWGVAADYGATLPGGLSYNYLTSLSLLYGQGNINFVEVKELLIPMLPYYMGLDGNYAKPSSDVDYSQINSDFLMSYYSIPNNKNGFEYLSGNLGAYTEYEAEYRQFVYDNYLYVDDETRAYLQKIIDEQGFSRSDPTSILKAAKYMQTAAVYNLNYNPNLDLESNRVIAFLDQYKEGICIHYATAATLLYRTMGIPARYVEGFMVETKKDTFVDIKTPGHAWVEVYVDGVGWIQIEVTGSDSSEDTREIITLTPSYCFKNYDGKYLYPENKVDADNVLSALLEQGYTYSVSIYGEQLYPGQSYSYIESFTLYDPMGIDVTNQYNILYNPGILQVFSGQQKFIRVYLYQLQKYYDGTPLAFENEDYEIIEIPDGVKLELDLNISMTHTGAFTLAYINANLDQFASYKVYQNGIDVTADFVMIFDTFENTSTSYVPIRIDPRLIEVSSASQTKFDDGTPLTNSQVTVSQGSLVSGHTLKANPQGYIDSPGVVENKLDPSNVRVFDKNGNDVTYLYNITTKSGYLTILEPEEN
ncbi:MAG: transglutaminase domain-containing protein [Clostridia bacterium]|nr:transglutaminase domain-containing protein [Clostridia bacterium]